MQVGHHKRLGRLPVVLADRLLLVHCYLLPEEMAEITNLQQPQVVPARPRQPFARHSPRLVVAVALVSAAAEAGHLLVVVALGRLMATAVPAA